MQRLALAALCLALLPAAGFAKKGEALSKDEQALQHYRLTLEHLHKVADVNEKLAVAAEKDKALAKVMSEDAHEQSIDSSVQRMNGTPAVSAALKQAGISARDYLLTTMAAFQAGMFAGLRKSGAKVELPPEVNPENVAFVQAHEAELAKMQERRKAFEKQHRVDSDNDEPDSSGDDGK